MAQQAAVRAESQTEMAVANRSDQQWARYVLPGIADFVFLMLFSTLVFTSWANRMLGDAGTGWHIRTGEQIISAHSIPRADIYSYTASGEAWFAWEWLYDIGIAGVHSSSGLNGVVVATALIIALTFALLFRVAFQRSGNVLVSLLLTFLSAVSASIHFLVRPHVVSWLFALLSLTILMAVQDGRKKWGYLLPLMTLLWANLHGGFIIGIALSCLFTISHLWTFGTTACPAKRARSRAMALRFSGLATLSAAASLVNPYGFRLWTHLYEYLSNPLLMNSISEFQSPNFHWLQMKFFAAFLLISILAVALEGTRIKSKDMFLVLFAVASGLYAARNIPISAIILTVTIAPIAAQILRDSCESQSLSLSARRILSSLECFTTRMGNVQAKAAGHILPIAIVILAVVASLNGGSLFSKRVVNGQFDPQRMPSGAVDFLVSHNIRTHFFSPDEWGGYLVYRMYPDVKLFIDDRHDMYGEEFVREYMEIAKAGPNWREVLNQYQVEYALVPSESPLASALLGDSEWSSVYTDGSARVFARTKSR